MKKIIILILLIFNYLLVSSQVKENLVIPKHPKIGLSLSGGGAKGFAHIGVLKVLDSLGVKVDYISGTSMGAIVGGLYASGYTAKDIEKIVKETDFYNLISSQNNRAESSFFDKNVDKYILKVPIKNGKVTLPSSISSGQKNIYLLKELFKNVSNTNDFSKFPIPFVCLATNLESGTTKVFEKGDISEAIMASSAFPSLMDPVKIGDSLYVDGAMTVNYPSEFLKKKGIDIVIGVDLNQGLNKKENINSIVDILNQVIDFGIVKETKIQKEYTVIYIHPILGDLGVTSFDNKVEILNIGYNEALKYAETLNQLPKKTFDNIRIPMNPIYSNVYKIDDVKVHNNNIYSKAFILGKMNLKLPSVQTYGSINMMIDKLYATNDFKIINYEIDQENNKNILNITVNEDNNRFFLKFGLHYDEIFKSSLLANVTFKRLFFKSSSLSIDGVFGDKPRYYLNYFIDNGYIPGFGINSSAMSFELVNNSGNAFEKWNFYRNEAFIQSIFKEKFAIGGGISLDHFVSTNLSSLNENKEHFLNVYAFIKSDTQDDKYFPTKGFYTNIEAKALNVFDKSSIKKTIQIKGDLRGNFPINNWLTYRLNSFYGISTTPANSFYQYHLGGLFEQDLGNFVRFTGYQFGQNYNNNIISVSNNFQFNVYKNYFIIANFSAADLFQNFEETKLLKINYSSLGITAAYKSPFGQIKLNYSHALQKDNKGIFSVVLGHWF